MNDWITDPELKFRLQLLIEVGTLAVIFYAMLRFLRSTRGGGLLRGLGAFLVAAAALYGALDLVLGVPVLLEILRMVAGALIIILVILFQPELRQGIARIGRGGFLRIFGQEQKPSDAPHKIARTAQRLAKERTGALIAFERGVSLAPYYENGVLVDAPVSGILLETIFYPGSPLHDGAVVMRAGRIHAAACLLPLADPSEQLGRLGTRHRAALGLTEETDAVTLVVSEETGQIALCANGVIHRPIAFDKLEERLAELLQAESRAPDEDGDGPSAAAEKAEEASR